MSGMTQAGDLRGTEFTDADLSGSRFVRASLAGVVMRGVDVAGMEIDAPWLVEGAGPLVVNGVDVCAFVDAELDRRSPGRELRRAKDPDGLRAAWAALQTQWAQTLARAASLPDGTLDASVDGEWSFAQTLRHLVMATDTWLGRAILKVDQPYHPIGQPNVAFATDGHDPGVFSEPTPSYERVLAVRAQRVGMVGDFIASVTPEVLDQPRNNPWDPECPETVRSCLHTILEEEWEHHRYAVRDLDTLARRGGVDG